MKAGWARLAAFVAVFAMLTGTFSLVSAQATGSLTVLDWAGFDAEEFWIDFKRDNPDVDVTFEIGTSDADIFAKMMAGDQADVFHPYTGWLQYYVDEGLVEELDTSRLKNWDKVPDRFKELGQFNGKQYFVPYDWGYSSIVYRTDLAPEAGESLASLMNPEYAGHISMRDDGASAVSTSAAIHGWDVTQLTPEQMDQIKQEWVDQRELNLFYWSGEPELVEAMASGDVWVGLGWQGAYALLRAQDIPVAYADPKEGRASWVGQYGIRKGTREPGRCLRLPGWQVGRRDLTQRGRDLLLRRFQPGRARFHHRPGVDRDPFPGRSHRARPHSLLRKHEPGAARRLSRTLGRRQGILSSLADTP